MGYGERNYGKLYFENIDLIKEQNLGSIPNSQKLYSLFPAAYDYDNSGGVCTIISLLSTEKFFNSQSFSQYARSLAGIQKELSQDTKIGLKLSDLNASPKVIFKKYAHQSKIINGDDISSEIMKYALTLNDGQKSSIILVIGNHSINIVIDNHKGHIRFGYYDVTFGQLYLQIVDKNEISQSLAGGEFKFSHPMSILNPDNILLGKTLLMRDDIVDTSIPIAFMSFITNEAPIKGVISNIKFADNLSPETAIKFCAKTMGMFTNIKSATDAEAFASFQKQYYKQIEQEYNNFSGCVKIIAKKNTYLEKALVTVIKVGDRVLKSKTRAIEEESSKHAPGEICLKEAAYNDQFLKAEKQFFEVIFRDKSNIGKAISQCLTTSSSKDQNTIAYKVGRKFPPDESDMKFTKYSEQYYNARDAVRDSKEPEACFIRSLEIIEQLSESHRLNDTDILGYSAPVHEDF